MTLQPERTDKPAGYTCVYIRHICGKQCQAQLARSSGRMCRVEFDIARHHEPTLPRYIKVLRAFPLLQLKSRPLMRKLDEMLAGLVNPRNYAALIYSVPSYLTIMIHCCHFLLEIRFLRGSIDDKMMKQRGYRRQVDSPSRGDTQHQLIPRVNQYEWRGRKDKSKF
jgi:hypothetical protein